MPPSPITALAACCGIAANGGMIVTIRTDLHYSMTAETDLVLQIEAAAMSDQRIVEHSFEPGVTAHLTRVAAEFGIGERVWLRVTGNLICRYTATVRIDRPGIDLQALPATPPHLLPADAVRCLMPSRYCPSDEFQHFSETEFGALQGGARFAAIADWVRGNLRYLPGSSHGATTALDTFVQRQGVCRDFSHVMICLLRASAIPARFASVYAPDANPPDFHAVVEVYLDGGWHLFDPTGMAAPDTMIRIGAGMDAAETSFLMSYGPIRFESQSVSVQTNEPTAPETNL